MDTDIFKVEVLTSEHVKHVTQLWRDSMSEALGIEPVHSFQSQAYFLEYVLPTDYQVVVVVDSLTALPAAFMASSDLEVNQLYVAPQYQNLGIGRHLLNLAKMRSNGSLMLRTFEVNLRAQTFYQSHGFAIRSGDSNNEEGLPDLVCNWNR
ncbi:GNAT family N-acetyltransferase [Vibrio sp. SCSIO 43135]|uniref:GNAT family N-acetyltransferase n=1 Tax=Vibrio sp. SCSIO 43135 TaxID=2819096 RepID=UPI002074EB51|nr:GNAT family N-acetyltransferase [Vibrio sp. SCSIO 43135]USD42632.1 GNAT family N-acetyltransferase [Vibrio sp. SCSIO 43135]